MQLQYFLLPQIGPKADFKVIAFYTAINDLGHISFVREAQDWFPQAALDHNFIYESTNDWNNLNEEFLSMYVCMLRGGGSGLEQPLRTSHQVGWHILLT